MDATTGQQFKLGEIQVDVVLKSIRNIHLGVYPPNGRVRVAAPEGTNLERLRLFLVSKLDWIKKQRKKVLAQERETRRDYLDRESHFVWGRRYLLKIVEQEAPPTIDLKANQMVLKVRHGTCRDRKAEVVEGWYRKLVKEAASELVAKWEPKLKVSLGHLYVRVMRTRWGTCNPSTSTIRLNTDLAKKPPECLEYIVVHELVHLLEPTHNARFVALMNRHMPDWRHRRQVLNSLPVRHEEWGY
jgi:predicted metal-dependent hydrolase